ncbi:hypothetical protein HPP92_015626 [Vanilla planifolia]|uniref:Uncharacterized protein n=1 Tax=Vanilla planifolia TaxID=51239 RepID=A0A835QDC4_VANPL|nr:hypothetical protein HPP92_016445 [Vanilla planifolia]KAG0471080.1 hypothetical protein HPP92_015626 [Vanilla planifolia]
MTEPDLEELLPLKISGPDTADQYGGEIVGSAVEVLEHEGGWWFVTHWVELCSGSIVAGGDDCVAVVCGQEMNKVLVKAAGAGGGDEGL